MFFWENRYTRKLIDGPWYHDRILNQSAFENRYMRKLIDAFSVIPHIDQLIFLELQQNGFYGYRDLFYGYHDQDITIVGCWYLMHPVCYHNVIHTWIYPSCTVTMVTVIYLFLVTPSGIFSQEKWFTFNRYVGKLRERAMHQKIINGPRPWLSPALTTSTTAALPLEPIPPPQPTNNNITHGDSSTLSARRNNAALIKKWYH